MQMRPDANEHQLIRLCLLPGPEYKERMRRLGQKPSNESYNAYAAKHFDKSKGFELDVSLMNQMADLYRQYMH